MLVTVMKFVPSARTRTSFPLLRSIRASVLAASRVMVSAPLPPTRLSTPRTARLLPVSARVRLSVPAPRSAVAPDRAPETVMASARAPPMSVSNPARTRAFAALAWRVTTDRGLLRLGAGAGWHRAQAGCPPVSKKETKLRD
jgi:hypothetical protein